MTFFRVTALAAALGAGIASLATGAAASECRQNAAEYAQVIRQFESEAARARVLADSNPLYESDVVYYASVLADARACQRQLAPVATASR